MLFPEQGGDVCILIRQLSSFAGWIFYSFYIIFQGGMHVRSHTFKVYTVPVLRERTQGLIVRELFFPATFIVLILISNYALSFVPNVKLFDLLVFVAGYSLGLRRGLTVAAIAWLVYANFNPWGFASAPLLIVLIASETFYVFAGVLTSRFVSRYKRVALLASAVIATTLYDITTNVYTGIFWAQISNREYFEWIVTALSSPGALMFMAVHVGSNFIFFSVFGQLLIEGTEKTKEILGWKRGSNSDEYV